MSIPDHNGTLPESHTALRDARRRQRNRDLEMSTRPLPPLTHVTQPFRHMPLVAAVGLLVIFFLVLFGLVPGVGAARRPVVETVEIAQVAGDAGWYVVKLADDRILQVIPPRSRARVTPAPQLGEARLTSTTLIQDGYSYARVKR